MGGPAGPQLRVDVVVQPSHNGEHCDGNSSGQSENPNITPKVERGHV